MKASNKSFNRQALLLSVAVISSMVISIGCSSNPSSSDCESNGSATMTFENRSSKTQYDVILDGSRIGSIWPDQSITRSVAAGNHIFKFKFAGTNTLACSQGTPNLLQCSSPTYSCTTDK